MSMLEQLGARLRATADGLPLEAVALAAERLRLATELLAWVRQESANPIGVPVLSSATEHLEQAAYALRVGQDTIGDYLAAIGLAYQATAPPDTTWREAVADAEQRSRPEPRDAEVSPLGRWWEGRVNYLAEHGGTRDSGGPEGAAREAARDSAQLLRQAAKHVRADDRDRLRAELARVEAPVGLGLAALAPPVLRRLAAELLGHEAGPKDVERLREEIGERVRRLMPKMPDQVVTEQLHRVCRVPPAKRPDKTAEKTSGRPPDGSSGEPPDEPTHPTDSAVAGAVLTGILLHRLGHDPETLRRPDDPDNPDAEPAPSPSGGHG